MATLKRLSEKDLQLIKKELSSTINAYWESSMGRHGNYHAQKEKAWLYTLIKTVRKYNELTKGRVNDTGRICSDSGNDSQPDQAGISE